MSTKIEEMPTDFCNGPNKNNDLRRHGMAARRNEPARFQKPGRSERSGLIGQHTGFCAVVIIDPQAGGDAKGDPARQLVADLGCKPSILRFLVGDEQRTRVSGRNPEKRMGRASRLPSSLLPPL